MASLDAREPVTAIKNQPAHGNYKGYYQSKRFALASLDPRLKLVFESGTCFQGCRVLDVGCNEGWVTCEIAQRFGSYDVVGVDIDLELIQLAWKRRRTIWSLQQPRIETKPEDESIYRSRTSGESVQRKNKMAIRQIKTRKRPSQAIEHIQDRGPKTRIAPSSHSIYNYFPIAMEYMFGPIHIPDLSPNGNMSKPAVAFPHNLTFRTADWVDQVIPEDKTAYDIVVAFSVSKWIHLNKSDDGLRRFFRKVYDVLQPGGSFILESQSWDSYAKARRMSKTLKQTYQALRLRPEDFPTILLNEIGFATRQQLGRTGEGGFDRPIDIYVKSRL